MNDSQHHSGKQSRRTQRGVSLIEVLVVLVILVTGILTIIRLFPSGFFSIQSTANAGVADSLGVAAISAGAQSGSSLPEAILPDNLLTDDLLSYTTNAAAYANYDPDDPNNLENARVVSNETIIVPTEVNGQSIYVVKYGPVIMPNDPSSNVTKLPGYFTVNSPYWTALTGDSTPAAVANSTTPTDIPQDTLVPGQERFLVDLTNKMIAVPYAAYTPDATAKTFTLANGQVVREASSYPQKMVLVVTCSDGKSYIKYLNVPPATPRNSTQPYAPQYVPTGSFALTYLPDTAGNYQGGWFDPTTQYLDSPAGQTLPNLPWVSVTLYRPYNGLANNVNTPFTNDPYEFKLLAGNIGANANPGSVGFNPKAAVGSGTLARKAKISYIVTSWQILHEDYDIPSLTGTGSTSVVRTSVPNLLLAGSANPDNSINPGIAGSSNSIVILDLDTGQIVAPGGVADPTNPDSPINNEDLNGTMLGPSNNLINVSYALGRLTFGSNAFGDNSKPADGSGTAPAHRIRVFYTADLNWTVAVQKPPAYFQLANTTGAISDTTPLAANEYAYDPAQAIIYFARCNGGKTVELDGTYTSTTGGVTTTKTFTDSVAIDRTLYDVGAPDVRVSLSDPAHLIGQPVPAGAAVTFAAVRGLSARAVVAWKERNQWKVHSVDAELNRTP